MITMSPSQVSDDDDDDDRDDDHHDVTAARRQFLLGTVLAKQKQELVTLITATLNLDLNLTCKLLDYTLDCSTTGKTHFKSNLARCKVDHLLRGGSLSLKNFEMF